MIEEDRNGWDSYRLLIIEKFKHNDETIQKIEEALKELNTNDKNLIEKLINLEIEQTKLITKISIYSGLVAFFGTVVVNLVIVLLRYALS